MAVFNHSEKRNVKRVFFKHGSHGVYLPRSAVKQNKIGQPAEALACFFFFKISENPAFKHFRHRCVVILPRKTFYGKTPVGFFVRQSGTENHHTGNIVTACGVRDVISFNKFGRDLHAEHSREFIKSRR